MLDLQPPPPTGWSPLHSVAYLLLGTAVTDNNLEQVEVDRIVELIGRYEGMDEGSARQAIAIAHGYLASVFQDHGRQAFFDSIVKHAALLANRYGKMMLGTVVQDMIAIAEADGTISDEELVFVHSAARAWGLDGEA